MLQLKAVRAILTSIAMLYVTVLGCGGENGESGGVGQNCETVTDCTGETVCVAIGSGESVCQLECSASADACGASGSCRGVGSLAVDVCVDEPDGETPDPEEQPRIPCSTDAECEELSPGAICATFQGARDCTIPCEAESDCELPALGGSAPDFFTCAADEGDASRDACLPDLACLDDPLACAGGPSLPD